MKEAFYHHATYTGLLSFIMITVSMFFFRDQDRKHISLSHFQSLFP